MIRTLCFLYSGRWKWLAQWHPLTDLEARHCVFKVVQRRFNDCLGASSSGTAQTKSPDKCSDESESTEKQGRSLTDKSGDMECNIEQSSENRVVSGHAGDAFKGSISDSTLIVDLLTKQQCMFEEMASVWGPKPKKRQRGLDEKDFAPNKRRSWEVNTSDEEAESGEENTGLDFEQTLKDYCATDDSEEESTEGDVYEDLRQFFAKDEKVGDPISQATADLVKAALKAPMAPAKERQMLERGTPSSCGRVNMPSNHKCGVT